MKVIYCTANVERKEEFIENLDEREVENYQIYDRVLAKSGQGRPRMDNPVWPGHNFSAFIQIDDSGKIDQVKNMVKKMNSNAQTENEKISCFVWPIEDFVFG